jgi:hypothetical protein
MAVIVLLEKTLFSMKKQDKMPGFIGRPAL